MNPLLGIDLSNVRMLTLDSENEIIVKLDADTVHRFKFPTKEERDAAFEEWVDRSGKSAV